jgi:UDP-N-acetylmuramoyl-L-alanyl-D-glutamate--2,6-diaminopimelate ligase
MVLIGVTGTNGKSTIVTLLGAILRAARLIPAIIGTIAYDIAGERRESINTTPESLDIYRLLDEAAARGATRGALEVSSHALALGRVWAVDFHTTVFTNLTRDHLDFHKDMDSYFQAKALLFSGQGAPPPRHAVVNGDDPRAASLPLREETHVTRYGSGSGCDLRAENVRADMDGLRFDIVHEGGRWPVASRLSGVFNVYNILAAFGAGRAQGIDPETVIAGVESQRAVPGRFEPVDEGQPFMVVVDYAHTDDALRNAIGAARAISRGRVITVFGCGGDRDRDKRPLMGRAAGELSDFVVLTSDNPRSEDPLMIMNDALVGLRRTDTAHTVDPDRASAIGTAIAEAKPGDVVLVAGKGHETYQVLNDRTIHFDDREVARDVLHSLGFPGRENE